MCALWQLMILFFHRDGSVNHAHFTRDFAISMFISSFCIACGDQFWKFKRTLCPSIEKVKQFALLFLRWLLALGQKSSLTLNQGAAIIGASDEMRQYEKYIITMFNVVEFYKLKFCNRVQIHISRHTCCRISYANHWNNQKL